MMSEDVDGGENRRPIKDVKISADPIPLTLHDQLKLSRLQATHQRRVGPGHRKAYSEIDISTVSTSINVDDISSATEEPSSPHPFFKKNTATSPTSTLVPGEFDSMMRSLSSIDSSGGRRAHHRRNKTEVPVMFTSTPSTTVASISKPCRSISLALDEDDLRKLVKQLESIIESQAEEIMQLQHEVDKWKARAQQAQQQ